MLVIYEWQAWDQFLLPALYPESCRLSACIGERDHEVVARLPSGCRWFAMHLNLTDSSRVPQGRARLIDLLHALGIVVLNGRVVDISKGAVQAACVACGLPSVTASRDGSPDEMVIVKSNANYGGMAEARLTPAERRFLSLVDHHRWSADAHLYRVVPRRDVASSSWSDPGSVVERFITNDHDVFLRVYVMGRRLIVTAAESWLVIKKMFRDLDKHDFFFDGEVWIERPVPTRWSALVDVVVGFVPVLRRFCAHVSLDFGAIDVVMNNARELFIIDVNTTPHWGRAPLTDTMRFLGNALV